MATVRKRPGRKIWQIRYWDPKRERQIEVTSGTEDKQKAEDLGQVIEMAKRGNTPRQALIDIIDHILGQDTPALRVPLVEVADTYTKTSPDLTPQTLRVRLGNAGRFLRWMGDNFPVVEYMDQVSRFHAVSFCDDLRDQVNRNKTFNNIRSDLQTVFEALLFKAGMTENPWKVVKNLHTRDSLHGRAFNSAEITAILGACKGKEWEGATLTSLYTGLRLTDVIGLRWDWIKGDLIQGKPSKTIKKNIEIKVPIHPNLKRYLESCQKTGGHIFPRIRKQYESGGDHSASPFKKILDKAGISEEGAYLSFHCLRHTFRTNLAAAGVNKDVAQKLGGWSSDISEIYNHDYEGAKAAIGALK